jgi:hypothetical protein
MAGQNYPGKFYSVRSGLLPSSGTPGDVYRLTDTGETFIVLSTGQLWNMAGLLAPGSSPVVGPQGPKGDTGAQGDMGPQGPQGEMPTSIDAGTF